MKKTALFNFTEISYQRLLLGCRFPPGTPAAW